MNDRFFEDYLISKPVRVKFHSRCNYYFRSLIKIMEKNKLLRKTISYHDYKEDFYHAFLAGIFAGAGYMVESNKEHGEGRSDVVVYDPIDGRVVIFEAKYSKTIDAMDQDCQAAIKQIDQRMYAKEYEDSCDEVICYGISFYKKRCTILKK